MPSPRQSIDYNLYSNWYKYAVISENIPTNQAHCYDMYYNYGKLTTGSCQRAGSENTWKHGRWQMTGAMEDAGQTKIVVDSYDLSR